ncbi:MAG: hypothetical protein VX198_00845 [Pseudomonadota bacterium]|nr:hypothetical protein [Pseudomonadota bacterium]MEE3207089.1 hypothetical protein [Pseudomonadota bacterium]MEE3260326.1 hypothetical protein [Pseudomonadota bacterium]
MVLGNLPKPDHPDYADAEEFLASAYNLSTKLTFSERTSGTIEPEIGREPLYPLYLAVLMKVDPVFGQFDLRCLNKERDCNQIYKSAQWSNSIFIILSGLIMFFTVRMISGNSFFPSIVSGLHIWLNYHSYKNHHYIISDPFSLLLMSAFIFSLVYAVQKDRFLFWIFPSLFLALLTLVKAVFLYFAFLLLVILLLLTVFQKNKIFFLKIFFLTFLVYGLAVGPWMYRNYQISDYPAITEIRGGIALSKRSILNNMNIHQYFAALTFWTRGAGDSLAKNFFSEKNWKPFELYNPEGFYNLGLQTYYKRLNQLVGQGMSQIEASRIVERRLLEEIVNNLPKHLLVTFPVFYRGLWVDEFILISFPAFIWATLLAWKNRRYDVFLCLLPSMFCLLFYSLFSPNFPRYQLLSLPAFSLSLGLFLEMLRGRIFRNMLSK